jgi:hypothetical protein
MLHHHMEIFYPSRQGALRYTSLEHFHMVGAQRIEL